MKSQVRSIRDFNISHNPRAAHADITNAPELFGDAEDGDFEEDGDAEDGDAYGDADYGDADYGDSELGGPVVTGLSTYSTLFGEAETGGPIHLSRGAKIAGLGAAALGAGLLVRKGLKKRKSRRNASLSSALRRNQNKQTITTEMYARSNMGKIPRNARMPFFSLEGATLNAAPISPREYFVADTLKYNMDRQATNTPYEVDIIQGTFAGITWTLSAVGTATPKFYVAVVIVIGINALAGNPGTIYTMTGSMPTIDVPLLISSNPFSFTLKAGYYSKFMIYPWKIVTNKPLVMLGSYDNANPIIFNITGLPASASVSMIVPGSQHSWAIAMRNRLI